MYVSFCSILFVCYFCLSFLPAGIYVDFIFIHMPLMLLYTKINFFVIFLF